MSKPVVLIAGAHISIGRAAFAKKGAKAVGAGRRDDAGKALAKQQRLFGSRPNSPKRAKTALVGRAGRPADMARVAVSLASEAG
jgi:NAD(P)-dependent dehydrogenase (short-subunit alcohol dehydrogenase family)